MPNFKKLTEQQLRNWVRDFGNTPMGLRAMAELQERGLPITETK